MLHVHKVSGHKTSSKLNMQFTYIWFVCEPTCESFVTHFWNANKCNLCVFRSIEGHIHHPGWQKGCRPSGQGHRTASVRWQLLWQQ